MNTQEKYLEENQVDDPIKPRSNQPKKYFCETIQELDELGVRLDLPSKKYKVECKQVFVVKAQDYEG
jgi:hypothetical protein